MTESPAATILVVDDQKPYRTLLAELLKDEGRILLAKNGAQALERAREHQPQLILLDVLMPEMDGYQVIQALKHDDATRHIPVIFISAQDAPADEERGLDLGAIDYISKPFHPSITRKRVRNHLQAAHHRHLLENLAMIDSLTEIANRRRFSEVLEQEWRRCARSATPLSLAVIDVDYFKRYNDHLGHLAGDNVLRQIAKVLAGFVRRPGDLVARYGGEEFVLLLSGTDAGGAQGLARELCATIEALHLPHPTSPIAPWVTISLGGVTLIPQGADPYPGFFEEADALLYAAKAAGRNQALWKDAPAAP